MFLSDGTLSAVTSALLLGITCLGVLGDLTKGSADFSGWGNSFSFVHLLVLETKKRSSLHTLKSGSMYE